MTDRLILIVSTGIDIASKLQDVTYCTYSEEHENIDYIKGYIFNKEINIFTRSSRGGLSAPHEVNYRGYMNAINSLRPSGIYATSIVGSLRTSIQPGTFAVLDQFIDFTKGRNLTIFDGDYFRFTDVTNPYCNRLRQNAINSIKSLGLPCKPNACYVGVDGPRYETTAEVKMFSLLGGDVVGMSNLPEVIFARELGICYSSIAYVANLGAGLSNKPITIEEINQQTILQQENFAKILLTTIENNQISLCSCSHETRNIPRYKA